MARPPFSRKLVVRLALKSQLVQRSDELFCRLIAFVWIPSSAFLDNLIQTGGTGRTGRTFGLGKRMQRASAFLAIRRVLIDDGLVRQGVPCDQEEEDRTHREEIAFSRRSQSDRNSRSDSVDNSLESSARRALSRAAWAPAACNSAGDNSGTFTRGVFPLTGPGISRLLKKMPARA